MRQLKTLTCWAAVAGLLATGMGCPESHGLSHGANCGGAVRIESHACCDSPEAPRFQEASPGFWRPPSHSDAHSCACRPVVPFGTVCDAHAFIPRNAGPSIPLSPAAPCRALTDREADSASRFPEFASGVLHADLEPLASFRVVVLLI